MQSFHSRSRYLLLIGLFAAALVVVATGDGSAATASPRWPTEDSVFQLDGWVVNPAKTELTNEIQYVTRQYRRADGGELVTLTLSTSPASKRIYRAGADVPFLGSGYTVEAAPQVTQWGAMTARRGDETWFQLHTYGERRGQLGNGVPAWGLSVLDTMLGRPNDYYIARVVAFMPRTDSPNAQAAQQVADGVFPRLSEWYSNTTAGV